MWVWRCPNPRREPLLLSSQAACVCPGNGNPEAAEPDSNPGRSLPASLLHATCLLQARGTFTTSGQHSSRAAKGPKDNSAQGLDPTRLAQSQALMASQRALGIKKSPRSFSLKSVLAGGDLAEAQQSPRRHNHGHQ